MYFSCTKLLLWAILSRRIWLDSRRYRSSRSPRSFISTVFRRSGGSSLRLNRVILAVASVGRELMTPQ